jgi:hypothetical protein
MLFVVFNEEGRRLYLTWPYRTRKQAPFERLDISLSRCDILDQPNIVCTGFYLGKEQRSMPENEQGREAGPRVVRAPRGTEISCKGWQQEAALRMLMNNLDPEVAERPDELVVYGGSGRAARSWAAFDAIVRALRALENDETLLVQSGKPVGIFRTHPDAPRVLIANSN